MGADERRARDRARYAADPERYRQKARAYAGRNREARAQYSRQYRAENPDKHAASKAAARAAYPERAAAYAKAYRARNPEKHRETYRRQNLKKYGLTPASRAAMLIAQQGLCAICCMALMPGRCTHVDHCHATSKVRGLLCNSCNLILGHARDNPDILESAMKYLMNASGIFTSSGAAID